MRSVLLIRCLPKMPPSSSTSTGSQTACNLEEILDMNNGATSAAILYHRRRGRCSSDHRRFLSEPGSARYSSTPSYLTIRKYSTTSLKLKSISLKNGDFFYQMCKWYSDQFNSQVANHLTSHSSFSLVSRHTADVYRYDDHSFFNYLIILCRLPSRDTD